MTIYVGDGGVIPSDLFSLILTKLPPKDLLQAATVCKCWRDHILSDTFQNIYLKFNELKYRHLFLKDLIRFSHIERLANTISHVQKLVNVSKMSLRNRQDFVLEEGDRSPFVEESYCNSDYVARVQFESESYEFWIDGEVPYENENNYDINVKDSDGNTPLCIFAERGEWHKCQALIEHGARVDVSNHNDETPLMLAIESGSRETVEVIFNAGAQINENDIAYAIRWVQFTIAMFLLEHVASVSKVSLPLTSLLINKQDELVMRLIKKGAKIDDRCLLHRACQSNNLQLTQAIVEAGADIHATTIVNETALSIAIRLGLTDMVDLLIQLGAKPDQGCYEIATLLWPGLVCLHTCIKNDFTTKCEYTDKLLHAATCGDLKYIKEQAYRTKLIRIRMLLFIAASHGQIKVLQYCLDKLDNTDYNHGHGKTALMLAVMNGQIAAVKLLLENGANPDLLDEFKMSSKDYAKKYWPDDAALNGLLNTPCDKIVRRPRRCRNKYYKLITAVLGISVLSLATWYFKQLNLKK
jgi:ankyrin repeat protein